MKLKNPEERARNIVMILNTVKETVHDFSELEFRNAIHSLGCPYSRNIFTVLKKRGLINALSKGVWNFSSKNPIHFKVIQPDIDKIAADVKDTIKKYHDKQMEDITEELKANRKEVSTMVFEAVDEARLIEYLKTKGYKVMRPVTNYEEV